MKGITLAILIVLGIILVPIILFSSLDFYVNNSIKQQMGSNLDCPQLNKQIDYKDNSAGLVRIFSNEIDGWAVNAIDGSTEMILTCKVEFEGEGGKKIVCVSDKTSSLTKSMTVTTPKISGKQKEITIDASYPWIINIYNANGVFENTLCKRIKE